MKKLFALITSLIMAVALFALPITASADEPEDTGTVLVDIDFSDDTVMDDFVWQYGGWKIVDGTLRPEIPWASTGLDQAISFEGKRIVLTVDFVIEYTDNPALMPALTIGIVDSVSDLSGVTARGAVVRFLIDNESLYSYFSGGNGWIVDSQWKFIQEELTVRTLEMTFDIDKTLTVKVDGEVLTHSNGDSMYKIDLTERYEGFAEDFVGYFAVKATGSTDTFIDNLKIVAYDTPAPTEEPPTPPGPTQPDDPDPSGDEPYEPEDPNPPSGGEPNGNNVNKGGCGSSLSGFSGAALVIASGIALAVSRKRKNR